MIISTTIIPEISGQISPWVLEHCSLLSNHDITSGYHIRESFTNQYRDYVQYDSNEECITETIQKGVSICNKNFCGFSTENPYYHLTSSQQTAYNYHEYDEEKILVITDPLDIRIVDRTESGRQIIG